MPPHKPTGNWSKMALHLEKNKYWAKLVQLQWHQIISGVSSHHRQSVCRIRFIIITCHPSKQILILINYRKVHLTPKQYKQSVCSGLVSHPANFLHQLYLQENNKFLQGEGKADAIINKIHEYKTKTLKTKEK